jgi:hypothetical protein
MAVWNEIFCVASNQIYTARTKVFHKKKKFIITVGTSLRLACGYVLFAILKPVWKIKKRMQAEGGFGSHQFDIGCLDSVIEF